MTIREFATTLGVSDRVVSKWEARASGGYPRPVNQAALDTLLTRSSDDILARFATAVRDGVAERSHVTEPATPGLSQRILVDAGTFIFGLEDEPAWLDAFYMYYIRRS